MSAAPLRRGACPTLPRPMLTGDGLLARIQPADPLSVDQLEGLASLAATLGNGILEVTARGKLQLRGLSEASAAALPAAVAGLGIEVPTGFAVETSALAGLDPAERADPRPLARALSERAATLLPRLAPKVSLVVDGGGSLHAGALKADIALVADANQCWRVVLAGRTVGVVAQAHAQRLVLDLLERLAAHGPAARMDDVMAGDGAARLRDLNALAPLPRGEGAVRPDAEPVGRHRLRDGCVALGLGLAFGQVRAQTLAALAVLARDADVRHVEPAAGRALLLAGLAPEASVGLERRAAELGFITDPADPRRRVFACAGQPACASARLETHVLAAQIAPLIAGGTLHVSGCVKGCAHPAPATLTIVGLDEGAGLVVEGTPRDILAATLPARIMPVAQLREAVAKAVAETLGGGKCVRKAAAR
ncbi:precorrin-3B synthase [Angulomicrobium tetraedrale]|uniref:Precorrin-3B synthase n=1 Tax=Ancylobacter tetraedralis TaxID=217068 RepID=A0A839ZAH6_9HYPH|nr:precorrin-3B synthase [Ancylobacter tetraedralis]MBB3771761.1 precorrin-3B synthase [Ancylobacter tetraedralis]